MLLQPVSVRPISELGPDALLEPMTVDEFAIRLAKKKITIKPLLLDQVQSLIHFSRTFLCLLCIFELFLVLTIYHNN